MPKGARSWLPCQLESTEQDMCAVGTIAWYLGSIAKVRTGVRDGQRAWPECCSDSFLCSGKQMEERLRRLCVFDCFYLEDLPRE